MNNGLSTVMQAEPPSLPLPLPPKCSIFKLRNDRTFLSSTLQMKGRLRIQYNCLVPIYVFPEMELLFTKQNYKVLSPSSYTQTSVKDLNISRIVPHILLQGNIRTDPGTI
jgi:hypothetical protein